MLPWYCLQCAILVLEFARALSQQIPACTNNACCHNSSYTKLDNSRRSIQSQWKSGQTPLCDRDHVTVSGWYRFTSFVGGRMPTLKVNVNRCGTHNPIWLDDTKGAHPTSDTDGVAKIKACINVRELRGGCYYRFKVGVKLCPGNFFVYYLQKIRSCYAAYCAGDRQPCPYGQTGTSLSTCSDVVPQRFPSLYLGDPKISVKDEPENEIVSLLCIVPIHQKVRQWKNVTYEIEWYTDGKRSKFTEKPFCKPQNGRNENNVSCPDEKTIHSLLNGTGSLNYYKPGQRITCKVKAKFTNNPLHPWSDTIAIQQPFFAGINVTPTAIVISECKEPLFHNITLTPTIPVRKNSVDKFLSVRFYLPDGLWLVNKEKCSVQLEGTNSVTVKVGATCTTLYGSKKLSVITPAITNPFESKFWGSLQSVFGLPTIWVTVLQLDQPLHKCLSVTDPHIRPLHPVSSSPPTWRHFFGHEEYLLYRNKERNFEVQTKQWACNRQGITCNCGAIIRDHNDLISFSCCGNPPKVYRDDFTPISVDIPRKKCLAPGIAITQLIKGVNSIYKVIVPTGITVEVERNYWGIDVTIYTPRAKHSQNELGLCTYSGHAEHITYLAGKYRLTASTSYFQTLPAEVNKDARPFETSCACSKTKDGELTDECVTDGIPVVSIILQSSGKVNRIKMCDNNIKPTEERKRRDIEGSDELTHEDFEVLMTPVKSNEHHREKRSVVSKENATRYCAERLLETRVGKLCAKLGTNVQALVNVCSADIEYTGDFSFAIGAVSMLMNECEDVVIENMTVNSNETNNVTKPTVPSALQKVLQLLCPNDCTFNGKCVNGSCVCNKDYTAADCSISIYQRPTITRIQSNGLCDRRKRPCEKTTVQGRDFLNSTNITCHIREIEIVNSSWIPNKNETKYQGTMTDLVLVECLLPSLPVLRMRYHETIEGTPAAGLMISVSNNGIDKSSQELKMISFDSVCMDCNVSAGCRLQKNACFINRYCFAPNEPNPRDWCQQCIPEVNTNSWTRRQVNNPPNVTLEANYYVVYRENFKLPIEAVDPEGMPVTVSIQEGSPKKAMIRNNVLYWNVATNRTTQFFFKATDACQASSTFNMTITVVPCPCNNSGQCVPQEPRGQRNYRCQCAPGYTGEYCGTEIDECASYPCLRGRCTDLLNDYSCSCDFGFEGRNCDLDIDYCRSSPCVNGNCTDEVSGYTCNCLPGYSGSRCEVDINECTSSPCLNNGTCVDQVNSFKCSCSAGYTGHNCSVNIDECQSSPCVNNGSCIDRINGFGCTCKAGFAGLQCEEDVDECLQVSCGNGTCFDRINNFSCVCDVGYMGRHCDVVITKCSNDSCYPGVPCMDKTVPISCGPCPSGFTGNGKNCKDIDDCDNHTCANGASCVDGINRYSCLCTTGFIGRYCEIDIDDCFNVSCEHGAKCVDGISNFTCSCQAGYTGTLCEADVDDCVNHTCANGGSCVDGVNSYLCSCVNGYYGDRCEKEVSTTPPTPKERSRSKTTSSKATSNPTTEAGVDDNGKKVFSLEIRLLEDWDNRLRDKVGRKFKDLATMIRQQIWRAYPGSSELKDVEIISMRPGSIIVTFKLTFKTEVITRDALAPLRRVTVTGKLGSLHVDPTSLKLVKADEPVPTTEGHPGPLNPTHIGLICAGVVFIAVVVIIGCYRCKASTRIQARRIEVEEATPADNCLRPEKYEMTEVTSKRENTAWLLEEKGIFNQGMQ
ncbi:von Willebrand factor D and EGF domain-containing protein-like isoform X2 [Acropora millepora]|uniref:von Willebrand factor D and EGF domain-containing protein-like isoform X2 n=1 Tax=Acropora millepora TaxID=45264 RepID=UPI001CF510F4|nr:von Willebrand factor D and EGF domain-containing protein-like isoform X2 [Acropora millepora]